MPLVCPLPASNLKKKLNLFLQKFANDDMANKPSCELCAYYQLKIGKTQKIRVCKNFAYGGPIGSIFRLSSFLTAKDRITKFDCKRLRMEHSFHIRSLKYTTLVYERYLGAIFNQAYFKLDAFVWSNTMSVPIFIKIC